MRYYSTFWIGYALGLLTLSPLWAARDAPEPSRHPAEDLSDAAWQRLSDAEHTRIVAEYVGGRRTPRSSHRVVIRQEAA